MEKREPTISRLASVTGRSIVLRDVTEADAEFILSLRLDPGKSRYLSPVEHDVQKQRDWIRRYRCGQGQAYFIICARADMAALGTVRIYDAKGDSFSWGSWILKEGAPASAAIESAVLVYQLATSLWGFRAAHFQVHRANASVVAFHERFGARRTRETPDEIFMRIEWTQIEAALRRYARYLPARLAVE